MAEYIDREAAVKAFNNFDAGRADSTPFTLLTPEEFAEYLYELPAADVAPVVHGRWIEKSAPARKIYFECSYCGAQENKHTAIKRGITAGVAAQKWTEVTTMRLIDADTTKQTYTADLFDTEEDFERVNDIFDYAPTVDAEVVTRCKDCEYRGDFGSCYHPRHHGILPTTYPLDFCSYGVRKNGGNSDAAAAD